jgi:hypothetical protein
LNKILVDAIAVKGSTVEIYELTVGLNVADLRGFEICTSTGYAATFPEAHTECDREVCVKPDGHDSYVRTRGHCHGVHHIEQVRAIAWQVAATYGSANKGKTDASVGRIASAAYGWTGHRVPPMTTHAWRSTEWARTMEQPISVETIAEPTLFDKVPA